MSSPAPCEGLSTRGGKVPLSPPRASRRAKCTILGSPFLGCMLGARLWAGRFVQMVSLSLDDNPWRLVLLTPRGNQGQRA